MSFLSTVPCARRRATIRAHDPGDHHADAGGLRDIDRDPRQRSERVRNQTAGGSMNVFFSGLFLAFCLALLYGASRENPLFMGAGTFGMVAAGIVIRVLIASPRS
jgi:hypothetical protein